MRILIVDDEYLIRKWLRLFIEQSHKGLEKQIFDATNGKEALEILSKNKIDLIITDIKMPIMDGLELVEIIQKEYPHIVTTVLSAYDELNYVKKALKSGANDYILKAEMQAEDIDKVIQYTIDQNQKPLQNLTNVENIQEHISEIFGMLNMLQANSLNNSFSLENNIFCLKFPNLILTMFVYLTSDEKNQYKNFKSEIDLAMQITQDLKANAKEESSPENKVITIPISKKQFLIIADVSTFGSKISSEIQTTMSLRTLVDNNGYILSHTSKKFHQSLADFKMFFFTEYNLFKKDIYYQGYQNNAFQNGLLQPDVNTSGESMTKEKLFYLLERQEFQKVYNSLPVVLDNMHQVKKEPEEIKYLTQNVCRNILIHNQSKNKEILNSSPNMVHDILKSETHDDLLAFLREIYSHLPDLDSPDNTMNPHIINAIKYVENHYAEKITLESVSEHVYLSSSYLSQLFIKETGMKFTDYVELIRLKAAAELLKNNRLLIKDVTTEVGFSSQAYFTRQFKKYTGMSPSEYRML